MIFDMRTYRVKAGQTKKHLELYEKHGYPPQSRILGEPVFYGVTETGPVNTYVHIWVYESAGDREAKRAVLWQDPEWLSYVGKSAELGALVQQDNQIMTPAAFYESPVKPI